MQKTIETKSEFEKEYFNKTFRTFYTRKLKQIADEHKERAQHIFNILDVQSSIQDLFYRSVKKQIIYRAIAMELQSFLTTLEQKLKINQSKLRTLKQIVFLQFYQWILEVQIGVRRTLSKKQMQKIGSFLKKLKIESQFEAVGVAQDYFINVLKELQTLGKFNFCFKDIIKNISQKYQFSLSQFDAIFPAATLEENGKNEVRFEAMGLIPENSGGKTSITSVRSKQTPVGKSSQCRSAKSSPQHSVGRTMFMSHPMRFKMLSQPGVKVVKEYYSKEEQMKMKEEK